MANVIKISDFALAATLECGQAFRWHRHADGWFTGIVGHQVWRLRQIDDALEWNCSRETESDETRLLRSAVATFSRQNPAGRIREYDSRLQKYLSLDLSLSDIFATFPDDPHLRQAARDHAGLRVLRQEPWECLASFIASSSKQIVQIRQIVGLLAERFGEPIDAEHHAFPTVAAIARASHQQLWDCKLGFRAKNLLAAARMIDSGQLDLHALPSMDYDRALEELMNLPGVGEKIANCVLLFSCGFHHAFPIDVWIERALRRIYFPGKQRVTARELRDFTRSHFGPYAGWAQQYLFFNERSIVARASRLS
ncbi:MAG TPA: DNA glycosylase [Verrucomicrobiae bacterium]|nr:DNA glycosylase [Verrucomicrobiae bacterium]